MRKRNKWNNKYYILIYKLACLGYNGRRIAGALGIPYQTFLQWKKKRVTVQFALEEARTPKDGSPIEDVLEFIYGRLPDDQKELYRRICRVDKKKNSYDKVKRLLENKGEEVKQRLFLYAMVESNFNRSEACRKICISFGTLKRWLNQPVFQGLMESIHEGTKDFFEGALVRAAKEGDTQSIIFANRTLNKDRGYGDKMEIEHKHTGKIEHTLQIDITKLSTRAQKEIYDQITAQEKETERLEEIKLGNGQQLLIPDKRSKVG